MSDIKLYRLTTGEEIVARYVGDYPDGHYVQNPIAMYAAEEGKIGFMPFMPYTDAADGLEIKDSAVIPPFAISADGLIDLCVVAIGTLDLFGIDAHKAWQEVHSANMSKEVGVKESRPNPLGLPDLIKPEGWTAPSHEYNHGLLNNI